MVFDYVAVQSKAVMSVSHLDRISSRETLVRASAVYSHGMASSISSNREKRNGVLVYCTHALFFCLCLCVLMHIGLCPFTVCPRMHEP